MFGRIKGDDGKVYAKAFTNEKVTVENIKKAKELLRGAKTTPSFSSLQGTEFMMSTVIPHIII